MSDHQSPTDQHPFELVVVDTDVDDGPTAGTRLGLFGEPVVLGRSPSADVVLDHATVSYEHLRLLPRDTGLDVVNLARNGTTFVGGEALETGATRELPPRAPYIQVGAFLLEARTHVRTVPHRQLVPIPEGIDDERLLLVELHVGGGRARCDGRDIVVPPRPLVVLAALAASTNRVVSRYTLMDWLSPEGDYANLDPIVHRLRKALGDALADGSLRREPVKDSMARAGRQIGDDTGDEQLVRKLIKTVRGQGYMLSLDPADVAFRRRHQTASVSEDTG